MLSVFYVAIWVTTKGHVTLTARVMDHNHIIILVMNSHNTIRIIGIDLGVEAIPVPPLRHVTRIFVKRHRRQSPFSVVSRDISEFW